MPILPPEVIRSLSTLFVPRVSTLEEGEVIETPVPISIPDRAVIIPIESTLVTSS